MKKINSIIFKTTSLIYIFFLIYAVYAIFNIRFIKLLSKTVDVIMKTNRDAKNHFISVCILLCIVVILFALCNFIGNYIKSKAVSRIRMLEYSLIMEREYRKNLNYKGQEYKEPVNNDVSIMGEKYLSYVYELLKDVIMCFAAVGILATMDRKIVKIILIMAIIFAIILVIITSVIKKIMHGYVKKQNVYIKGFSNIVNGHETFTKYDAKKVAEDEFDKINKELCSMKKNTLIYKDILTSSLGILINILTIGVLIFGMYIALGDDKSLGELFAFMTIGGIIFVNVGDIIKLFMEIYNIKNFIDEYDFDFCKKGVIKGKKCDTMAELSCKNLSLELMGTKLLDNINIVLEKGKKYVFMGEGKLAIDTLVKTILGYYDEYKGDVYYNDISIKNIDKSSIETMYAYIPENPILFSGTVKDNITMFCDNYNNLVIEQVVKLVNLDEKVASLENGLNTLIDSEESIFTKGEKQRIFLARAFLSGREIFILDNPTSYLDKENYMNIERILLSIKNITLIKIDNRIKDIVLKNYDKIYLFKDNSIKEEGSFEELMYKKGYFLDLYRKNVK